MKAMNVELPQDVHHYLSEILVYTGFLWLKEMHDLPRFVMKLPTGTTFMSSTLSYGTFRRNISHSGQSVIQFKLLLQHASSSIACDLKPSKLYNPQAIQALVTVDHIEVYAFADDLSLLGVKSLSWPFQRSNGSVKREQT